jgi:class 3 adenylate cyclase
MQDVAIAQAVITEVLTKKHAVRSLDTFGHGYLHTPDVSGEAPLRGVMCVPLLVDDEEVLGLIHADTSTHPHALTDQDLEVLSSIGTQAAIAMKNAHLYDTVQPITVQRISVQRTLSPKLMDLFMADALHSALEGQRERGTILCADMIGLTALSVTMPPQQVVTRLQRYMTVMQRLIHEYGGNFDRGAGDTLMAFWGVLQPDQEDEGEAVRTALRMQASLWPLNLQLEAEGQLPIAMGVGLHTGELIAGNIGTQDALTLTVIGESSTLATRIVQMAAHAQVLVADTTRQPIRQLVGAIQLPPLALSGQTAPLMLYAIRSIQQRTRSACLLALPCTMLNRHGKPTGQGMITESTAPGKALRLFFSTPRVLQLGEVLTLQPLMPEYHAPLSCVARVESCVRQAHENQQVYTKAVLTVLEGSDFIEVITPGSCVTTTHPWEALGRV